MNIRICIVFVVLFSFVFVCVANAKNDSFNNGINDNFHFNLSLGIPTPFVSGYVTGIEGMAGFEFLKHFELRLKLRKEGVDGMALRTEQKLVQGQFVYYGKIFNNRLEQSSWVKKYGLMAGYAFRWGDHDLYWEEDGENYQQFHILLLGLIFKTVYRWEKYFGLMMQLSAIGGVSIHTYASYIGSTSNEGCLLTLKNKFAFGDYLLWELGFHIGLEF